MVNTGQPSKACVECKRRRVKCDETRPQFQRCQKYGVECPGYPAKDVVFRDDTDRVRQRAFKKYEKKQRSLRASSALDSLNAISEPLQMGPPIDTIPTPDLRTPRSTLIAGAVATFMHQWSIPDLDVFWGALDSVPELYKTAPAKGCFRIGLEALALLTMALPRDSQKYDIRKSAMRMYGAALKSVNIALGDLDQRVTDHTFMAVIFICIFETLTQVPDAATRAAVHLRGLMTMVDLRGPGQFSTATGRRLFLVADFLWNIGTMPLPEPHVHPLPPSICEVLLNNSLDKHERAYRLVPIAHKSVDLRVEALALLKTEIDQEKLLLMLDRIRLLDMEYLRWHNECPGDWVKRDHLYELLTVNIFRAHRVFLCDLCIKCHTRLSQLDGVDRDDEIGRSVQLVQEMVDEMCASIPYGFGEDDPNERVKVREGMLPDVEMDFFCHMSFSFPLLVSSMVDSLSETQKKGIEAARMSCAKASGLQKPFRTFPSTLVQTEGVEV